MSSDTKHAYLDRIRGDSAYPFFRGFVWTLTAIGALGSIGLGIFGLYLFSVGGIYGQFAMVFIIGGAIMFALTIAGKEVSSMLCDIADATIDSASRPSQHRIHAPNNEPVASSAPLNQVVQDDVPHSGPSPLQERHVSTMTTAQKVFIALGGVVLVGLLFLAAYAGLNSAKSPTSTPGQSAASIEPQDTAMAPTPTPAPDAMPPEPAAPTQPFEDQPSDPNVVASINALERILFASVDPGINYSVNATLAEKTGASDAAICMSLDHNGYCSGTYIPLHKGLLSEEQALEFYDARGKTGCFTVQKDQYRTIFVVRFHAGACRP
jgi:hypothetical protein